MFEIILHNLKEAVMITSFVMVMMLIIEYINVQSKGNWSKKLQKNSFLQVVTASLLGIIPGCLGTFTVVSLFTHNIMNFGALVAVMIATTGDEAFVMFSQIPSTSVKLTVIIFGIALVTGFIVNAVMKNKRFSKFNNYQFEVHQEDYNCKCYSGKDIFKQLRHLSFPRAILLAGLLLFILGLVTNQLEHVHNEDVVFNEEKTINLQADKHENETVINPVEEHDHSQGDLHEHAVSSDQNSSVNAIGEHDDHDHGGWNWVKFTFLITSILALAVVVTVPDHFLQDHLWGHIIKKHFPRIFLWTAGTLLVLGVLMHYFDVGEWLANKHLFILFVALLIGIIPESGPHLIFISLFATNSIPFSVLLANSIVQDGHGALPLFAESKKSFVAMKAVNLLVGLIVGLLGFFIGF